MKKRGSGSIYPRPGTSILWCVYHLRGKRFREPTGETDEKSAQKYLDRRLMEIGADKIGCRKFVAPAQEKLLISDLLDALAADYELRGKFNAPVRSHLKHMYQAFGDMPAMQLTAEAVDEYILARQKERVKPATINRRTDLLRQSYTLAIQRRHLLNAPFVRHVSEKGNARRGFFEENQFRAVCERLPQDLADLALYGYLSGWRAGECATLGWDDVEGDVIRLRAEHSKTGEARQIVLVGELAELIERRGAARRVTTPNGGVMLADLIFHHQGKPIGDMRKPWQLACCTAGVGKFVCRNCEGTLPFGRALAGTPPASARHVRLTTQSTSGRCFTIFAERWPET